MLEIIRREHNPFETLGFLVLYDRRLGFVLEPPDLRNRPDISCMPEAAYLCRRINSQSFGLVWHVPVPDRTDIFIHWGNTIDDTLGCPIPGLSIGWYKGKRAVLDSKKAFNMLMQRTEHLDELKLVIRNEWSH